MIYVYRLLLENERIPVAYYANEDLARHSFEDVKKHLKKFLLPSGCIVILEQWRSNSILEGAACVTIASFPL